MEQEDLSNTIKRLKSITDEDLATELRELIKTQSWQIPQSKYDFGFAALGVSNQLINIKAKSLVPPSKSYKHRDKFKQIILPRARIVFHGYTAFVLLRSQHLEVGLKNLKQDSKILEFKTFYEKNKGLSSHIRNSLSHGTFEIGEDSKTLIFTDGSWSGSILITDFFELCEQVQRFYFNAFEAQHL